MTFQKVFGYYIVPMKILLFHQIQVVKLKLGRTHESNAWNRSIYCSIQQEKKRDREKSERGDFDMKHCFCHAVSFTDVFLRTTTATAVSSDNYSTNILLHQTTEFNCNAIFMGNTDAVEKSISRNVYIYKYCRADLVEFGFGLWWNCSNYLG